MTRYRYRYLLSLVLVLGIAVSSVGAKGDLLEKLANISAINRKPTISAFTSNLDATLVDLGEPIAANTLQVKRLDPVEQAHFYLLARMIRLGWLAPLLKERWPYPCDALQLQLQSTFVPDFEHPAWCDQMQWDAAKWLLDKVNGLHLKGDPDFVRKLFLLVHTAGADLSPLEVKSAIAADNLFEPTKRTKIARAPYLSEHEYGGVPSDHPYEAWLDWQRTRDPKLRSAPIVFFWNQRMTNSLQFMSRREDVRGASWQYDIFKLKSTQYFIGDTLELRGGYGLDIDPDLNTNGERYVGYKLIVNQLVLDRTASPLGYGELNMTDVIEPPVIRFVTRPKTAGNFPVITARKTSIGPYILETPQRMFAWLTGALKLSPSENCPITGRLLEFAVKQIDHTNPYLSDFKNATQHKNCVPEMLAAWRDVLSFEIENRPQNVLHRFIDVIDATMPSSPVGVPKRQIYVTTDFDIALKYFGQTALESWGLAAARQLNQRISDARIQDDLQALGQGLRDTLVLRSHLLTKPTSATTGDLSAIFDGLTELRNRLRGVRRVVPKNWLFSEPALAGIPLVGAAASLDIWNFPSRARVVPLARQGPLSHKFARVWLPPDQGDRVNIEFTVELDTPKELSKSIREAVEARGYSFGGQYSAFKKIDFRQQNSDAWRYESILNLGESRFLVSISISQNYFSTFGESIIRAPGIPAILDWVIESDPELTSATYGALPLSSLYRTKSSNQMNLR